MPSIRCPECRHVFKVDRGKIVHRYKGSTEEEIRLAREALEEMEMTMPLPIAVVDQNAPAWLADLGIQGHLGEVIEWLGQEMRLSDDDA